MRVRYAFGIAVAAALLVPAATAVQAQAPATVLKKSAPPTRGVADVDFIQAVKLEGNIVVTTFQIRNKTPGAIAGFTISEFWYDKAGNALQGTGDRQRVRTPIQPGEIVTVTLRSPKVPGMANPQYKFEHANGTIKPTKVKSMK